MAETYGIGDGLCDRHDVGIRIGEPKSSSSPSATLDPERG